MKTQVTSAIIKLEALNGLVLDTRFDHLGSVNRGREPELMSVVFRRDRYPVRGDKSPRRFRRDAAAIIKAEEP